MNKTLEQIYNEGKSQYEIALEEENNYLEKENNMLKEQLKALTKEPADTGRALAIEIMRCFEGASYEDFYQRLTCNENKNLVDIYERHLIPAQRVARQYLENKPKPKLSSIKEKLKVCKWLQATVLFYWDTEEMNEEECFKVLTYLANTYTAMGYRYPKRRLKDTLEFMVNVAYDTPEDAADLAVRESFGMFMDLPQIDGVDWAVVKANYDYDGLE